MAIIIALLCASVAAVFVPTVIYFIRRLTEKPSFNTYRKSTVSRMFLFSACLIAALWCLRYAVGYFSIITAKSDAVTLTWWEEIFNSLLHALQTFSMDENYIDCILNGKKMIGAVLGEGTAWETVYGLYDSVLSFIAPIAGGAIIFEILASVFPKIRLSASHWAVWKEKYYFSELNAASLALAKSICSINTGFFKKPIIVFTDAYADKETEKSSEMLLEAKLIRAICIRDDLSHVKKNRFGRRKFFLIDEAESGNLKALADLANSENSKYLKKSEIYLFTNDDAYVQLEKSVRDRLVFDLKFSEEEMPVFIPIQSYRNLISNLLTDVPLYEPIIGKKPDGDGNQTLTVTILGTGNIGTQMFLSSYWLGQILNCKLKINVLSNETEEEFWSKIDYINPEIKHTTIEGDPILQINRKGDVADVYCRVDYLQCDVKSSKFVSCLVDGYVLDTDYFLISLGSDEENISIANTVREYVGQHHIKQNGCAKTVIAYVVYDSELSKALNRNKFYSFTNSKPDVYMKAIGSLLDVYSVENVFLTEHEAFAQKAQKLYDAIQNVEERAKTHKKRMLDDYKHWANLARGMHIKYKAFSMGVITESIFDYPNAPKDYAEKQTEFYQEYKRLVTGEIVFATPEQEAEHLQRLHKLSWLEHRRWNAFTRVKGFRGTTDYDAYAVVGKTGSYKQMDLKLHPCLVECDQKGIRADISPQGIINVETLLKCDNRDDFDLLDDLSYDLYSKGYNDYDFKQYDYPISDF